MPLRDRDAAWWEAASPGAVLAEVLESRAAIVERHLSQSRRRRRALGIPHAELADLIAVLDARGEPVTPTDAWLRLRLRAWLTALDRIPVAELLAADPVLADAVVGLICGLVRDIRLRPVRDAESEALVERVVDLLSDFVVEIEIRRR